jgi:predicted RNase H-like nuclease
MTPLVRFGLKKIASVVGKTLSFARAVIVDISIALQTVEPWVTVNTRLTHEKNMIVRQRRRQIIATGKGNSENAKKHNDK